MALFDAAKSGSAGISRHSCWTGCALRCRRGSQERPKSLFFAASWDFNGLRGRLRGPIVCGFAFPEGLVPEGLRSLKWFTGTRSSDRIEVSTDMDQSIRIRLKAFDHRVLDFSTREIVNTAKRTGHCPWSDSAADPDRKVHREPLAARR